MIFKFLKQCTSRDISVKYERYSIRHSIKEFLLNIRFVVEFQDHLKRNILESTGLLKYEARMTTCYQTTV